MTNLNHTLTKSIVSILSDTFIETTKPYQIRYHQFGVLNPVREDLKYTSLTYQNFSMNKPSALRMLEDYYNSDKVDRFPLLPYKTPHTHFITRYHTSPYINPDLLTLPL